MTRGPDPSDARMLRDNPPHLSTDRQDRGADRDNPGPTDALTALLTVPTSPPAALAPWWQEDPAAEAAEHASGDGPWAFAWAALYLAAAYGRRPGGFTVLPMDLLRDPGTAPAFAPALLPAFAFHRRCWVAATARDPAAKATAALAAHGAAHTCDACAQVDDTTALLDSTKAGHVRRLVDVRDQILAAGARLCAPCVALLPTLLAERADTRDRRRALGAWLGGG